MHGETARGAPGVDEPPRPPAGGGDEEKRKLDAQEASPERVPPGTAAVGPSGLNMSRGGGCRTGGVRPGTADGFWTGCCGCCCCGCCCCGADQDGADGGCCCSGADQDGADGSGCGCKGAAHEVAGAKGRTTRAGVARSSSAPRLCLSKLRESLIAESPPFLENCLFLEASTPDLSPWPALPPSSPAASLSASSPARLRTKR